MTDKVGQGSHSRTRISEDAAGPPAGPSSVRESEHRRGPEICDDDTGPPPPFDCSRLDSDEKKSNVMAADELGGSEEDARARFDERWRRHALSKRPSEGTEARPAPPAPDPEEGRTDEAAPTRSSATGGSSGAAAVEAPPPRARQVKEMAERTKPRRSRRTPLTTSATRTPWFTTDEVVVPWGSLMGMGNPLLDISAEVGQDVLDKYGVKVNHRGLQTFNAVAGDLSSFLHFSDG